MSPFDLFVVTRYAVLRSGFPRWVWPALRCRETLASSTPIRPHGRAALLRPDPPLQVVRGTDWPLGVTDATPPVHGCCASSNHGLQSDGPQLGAFGASGWNTKLDAGDGHGSSLRLKYLATFVTEGPYATGDCPALANQTVRAQASQRALRRHFPECAEARGKLCVSHGRPAAAATPGLFALAPRSPPRAERAGQVPRDDHRRLARIIAAIGLHHAKGQRRYIVTAGGFHGLRQFYEREGHPLARNVFTALSLAREITRGKKRARNCMRSARERWRLDLRSSESRLDGICGNSEVGCAPYSAAFLDDQRLRCLVAHAELACNGV